MLLTIQSFVFMLLSLNRLRPCVKMKDGMGCIVTLLFQDQLDLSV